MNNVRQQTGTGAAYRQKIYGSGIGIAVLDSGICRHPDFLSKEGTASPHSVILSINAKILMMTMAMAPILPVSLPAAVICPMESIWEWHPKLI